jgi:hypothetical protein
MRISSGVVVVSRISLCNELGLCSSNYFHPSPGNEKVEIKKLSEIRFIIIEVWEDIIIYQFYETYIYEIKK